MGVWPAGVGPTGRLFWAAGGALGALEGHGPQPVCIFVDSALPAHAVGCSVRVSCSTNFLLHEGMLVVCIACRSKSLLHPLPQAQLPPPTQKSQSDTFTGAGAPRLEVGRRVARARGHMAVSV